MAATDNQQQGGQQPPQQGGQQPPQQGGQQPPQQGGQQPQQGGQQPQQGGQQPQQGGQQPQQQDGNSTPTGSVTISGAAQQNQTLTASNNLADANNIVGAVNYQWLSGGNVVSNQYSYVLTQNDVGKNISVKASYTDGLNKAESVTSSSVIVLNVNDLPTGAVSISGDAKVGQTLIAQNTLQDLDGLGVISYQWLNNGAVLSSQSSYTLTNSDAGKTISLKASYTDLQNTPENVTSSSVTVAAATNYAPTGSVTISGTAQQNQTLTANNNLADTNNIVGNINYQWLSGGNVISTQGSYVLTQNDVGKNISVTASYTDGLNKAESVTSSSVTVLNVNDLPTGSVSISGDAKVGQTLTAQNTLQDLDGLGVISYQWLNNGAVLSSQSSYTLTNSDAGKTISLKASYTDLQNTPENVMSSSVSVAAAISIKETAPKIGDTLHVVNAINDSLGMTNIKYQWQNQPIDETTWNTIKGATSNTYQVDSSLNGAIRVEVIYNEDNGQKIKIDSDSVTIGGGAGGVSVSYDTPDVEVGTVLKAVANLNDLQGVNQVTYQWFLNNDTPLTAAIAKDAKHPNADQYTVAQGDSNHSIYAEVVYRHNSNSNGAKGDLVTFDSDLIPVVVSSADIHYTLSIAGADSNDGSKDVDSNPATFDVFRDSATPITFTITATSPSEQDVTIPFTLSGSSKANVDYKGELTTKDHFVIPAGEVTANINFSLIQSNNANGNKNLMLTLKDPSDGGSIDGDTMQGVTLHDIFQGKTTADKFTAKAQSQAYGNGGADILNGAAGQDTLDGGAGNDVLTAGLGDELTGGVGNDTFIFKKGAAQTRITDSNMSLITDLTSGDKIDLSAISKTTLNLVKGVASNVNGTGLTLSKTKMNVYLATDDSLGDATTYLVYETASKGSTHAHEIIELQGVDTASLNLSLKAGVVGF